MEVFIMNNNEKQLLMEKKELIERIEVEGYDDCGGPEDYKCDHDCIFFHNAIISAVE